MMDTDSEFILYLEYMVQEAKDSHPLLQKLSQDSISKLHSNNFHESVFETVLMAFDANESHILNPSLSCLKKLVQSKLLSPPSLNRVSQILRERVYQGDDELKLKILELLLIIMQVSIDSEDEEFFMQLLRICFNSVFISYPTSKSLKKMLLLTEKALFIYYKRVEIFEGYTKKENISSILNESLFESHLKIDHSPNRKLEKTSYEFKDFLHELSISGKSGLRLVENLSSLASFGKSEFLHLKDFPRPLAFEFLKYTLLHNFMLFTFLSPYHQTLHNLCSLLSSSLKDASDSLDIHHFRPIIEIIQVIIKNFSSSILYSECESLLTLLIDTMKLDLPVWHHVLVLQMMEYIFSDTKIVGNIYQQYYVENTNVDLIKIIVDKVSQNFENINISDINDECFVLIEKWFSEKDKSPISHLSLNEMDDNSLISYSYIFTLQCFINLSSSIHVLIQKMVLMEEETESGKEIKQILIPFYQSLIESIFENILNSTLLSISRVNGTSTVNALLTIYENFIISANSLELFQIRDLFLSSLCNITKNKIKYVSNIDKKRMGLFYSNFCLSISEHLKSIFHLTRLTANSFSMSSWSMIIELFFALHQFFPVLSLSAEKLLSLESCLSEEVNIETEFLLKLKIKDEFLGEKEKKNNEIREKKKGDYVGDKGEEKEVERREGEAEEEEREADTKREGETGIGGEGDKADQIPGMKLEQLIFFIDKKLFSFSRQLADNSLMNLMTALIQFSCKAFGASTSDSANESEIDSDMHAHADFSMPKHSQPSDQFRSWPTEKMIVILSHNMHRLHLFWEDLSLHFVELAVHRDPLVRQISLDALRRSIVCILNSNFSAQSNPSDDSSSRSPGESIISLNQNRIMSATLPHSSARRASLSLPAENSMNASPEPIPEPVSGLGLENVDLPAAMGQMDVVECAVVRPLTVLCEIDEPDVRSGVLSIILNILQNNGDKLNHSWPDILQLLRVASCYDKM